MKPAWTLLALVLNAQAAPPAPVFTQRIDAQLPLQLPLRDADGRAVRLGDYFGAAPVVLVLGYYRCRNLCSLVLDDALQAVLQSGASHYQVVGVSIDPAEGPSDAAPRQAAYRAVLGGSRLALLTGEAATTAALARAAGFGYRYDAQVGQFVHAAGFLVASPQGRVSRYFLGLRYQPTAVRAALARADEGASSGLAEQVSLLCVRLGAVSGHGGAALLAVRATAAAALAALALLLWRARRRESS